MSLSELALRTLIIISAVVFAIFTGRAKGRRLRRLHNDVVDQSFRGVAILSVVTIAVIATIVASYLF